METEVFQIIGSFDKYLLSAFSLIHTMYQAQYKEIHVFFPQNAYILVGNKRNKHMSK